MVAPSVEITGGEMICCSGSLGKGHPWIGQAKFPADA